VLIGFVDHNMYCALWGSQRTVLVCASGRVWNQT